MIHTYKHNGSTKTLVLFHGTGGDEHSLIALAQAVAPDFNHLSLRGDVVEDDGMRRFAHISEKNPIIDAQDMLDRVPDIVKIIKLVKARYQLQEMWGLGFSNGANALEAILLDGEPIFEKAILLRPCNLDIKTKELYLNNMEILIHSGAKDDIIPPIHAKQLEERLQKNGARVEHKIYDLDHWMRGYEVRELKEWFESKV